MCTLSLTVLEKNQNPVSDSAWLNYWRFFGCKSLRTSWSLLVYRVETIGSDVLFLKILYNVKCYVIKEYWNKFLLREIELHYKQLFSTVEKHPSTGIHFQKFLQKKLVVESFFWSNHRLAVQSSHYIRKWLDQECFLGNLPLGLFRSNCPQPSIFENFSRKYRS